MLLRYPDYSSDFCCASLAVLNDNVHSFFILGRIFGSERYQQGCGLSYEQIQLYVKVKDSKVQFGSAQTRSNGLLNIARHGDEFFLRMYS